ncbi:MAG: hypothetical protein ACKVVP_09590 [Chloroflexota bacterium]
MGRSHVFGGALLLATAIAAATSFTEPSVADAAEKITICHRTNSILNPYETISVSLNSLGNGNSGRGGHAAPHEGPRFDPTIHTHSGDDWGDILYGALLDEEDEYGCALIDVGPG